MAEQSFFLRRTPDSKRDTMFVCEFYYFLRTLLREQMFFLFRRAASFGIFLGIWASNTCFVRWFYEKLFYSLCFCKLCFSNHAASWHYNVPLLRDFLVPIRADIHQRALYYFLPNLGVGKWGRRNAASAFEAKTTSYNLGSVSSTFYLLRTSSTARRITSASVIPSFVACLTIHACWEALKTICRWTPFIENSCSVDNETRLQPYWNLVK